MKSFKGSESVWSAFWEVCFGWDVRNGMMSLGSNFKGVVHPIRPGDRRCFVSVRVGSVCSVLFPLSKFLTFLILQFSCSVVSDSLRPHESQHARPPCPSPAPGVYSNSCPSSRWHHPAISSSVVPFSSCPQSLPASGSFPMSQLFWSLQVTKMF